MVKFIEMLDTKVPFEMKQRGTDYIYTFLVRDRPFTVILGYDDDLEIESAADLFGVDEESLSSVSYIPQYTLVFRDEEDSMGITGKGDAPLIFSGVASCVRDFFQHERDPLILGFGAKEPSRARLYDHFAKLLSKTLHAPLSDYETGAEDKVYYLLCNLSQIKESAMKKTMNLSQYHRYVETVWKQEEEKARKLQKNGKLLVDSSSFYPYILKQVTKILEDVSIEDFNKFPYTQTPMNSEDYKDTVNTYPVEDKGIRKQSDDAQNITSDAVAEIEADREEEKDDQEIEDLSHDGEDLKESTPRDVARILVSYGWDGRDARGTAEDAFIEHPNFAKERPEEIADFLDKERSEDPGFRESVEFQEGTYRIYYSTEDGNASFDIDATSAADAVSKAEKEFARHGNPEGAEVEDVEYIGSQAAAFKGGEFQESFEFYADSWIRDAYVEDEMSAEECVKQLQLEGLPKESAIEVVKGWAAELPSDVPETYFDDYDRIENEENRKMYGDFNEEIVSAGKNVFEWRNNSNYRKAKAYGLLQDFMFEFTFTLVADGSTTWPIDWRELRDSGVTCALKVTIDQLNNYDDARPKITPDVLEIQPSLFSDLNTLFKAIVKSYHSKFGKSHYQYAVITANTKSIRRNDFFKDAFKSLPAGWTRDEILENRMNTASNHNSQLKYFLFKNSGGPKLKVKESVEKVDENLVVSDLIDSNVFSDNQIGYVRQAQGIARSGKARNVEAIEKILGKAPLAKTILTDILFGEDFKIESNILQEANLTSKDLSEDEKAYLDAAEELVRDGKAISGKDIVDVLGPGPLGEDWINEYFFAPELQMTDNANTPIQESSSELRVGDIVRYRGRSAEIVGFGDPEQSVGSSENSDQVEIRFNDGTEIVVPERTITVAVQGKPASDVSTSFSSGPKKKVTYDDVARALTNDFRVEIRRSDDGRRYLVVRQVPNEKVLKMWKTVTSLGVSKNDVLNVDEYVPNVGWCTNFAFTLVHGTGYTPEVQNEVVPGSDLLESMKMTMMEFGPLAGPQIGSAPRPEDPTDTIPWPKEIRTDEVDWPDGKPEDDELYEARKTAAELRRLATQKFSDTSHGAVNCLLSMANANIKLDNIKAAYPDPQVEGVWEILFKKPLRDGSTKAIVYMAGYREPYGNIRVENDFETGTEYDDLDEDADGGNSVGTTAAGLDANGAIPADAGHNWKKDAKAQGLTEATVSAVMKALLSSPDPKKNGMIRSPEEAVRYAGIITRDDKTPFQSKGELATTIYQRVADYKKANPDSRVSFDPRAREILGLSKEQQEALAAIVKNDSAAWDQAQVKGKDLSVDKLVQLYLSILRQQVLSYSKA